MQPTERRSNDTEAELIRRHQATALTVRAILVLIVLLSLLAFIGRNHLWHDDTEHFEAALKITILILGLGSVILRRTMFSATRLQDVTAIKGTSGLLSTLTSTTLMVALLGAAMAVFGFIATVMTGNDFYSYGAGLVGFVVLLHAYPTRKSWQRAVQRFGESETSPPQPPTFQTSK